MVDIVAVWDHLENHTHKEEEDLLPSFHSFFREWQSFATYNLPPLKDCRIELHIFNGLRETFVHKTHLPTSWAGMKRVSHRDKFDVGFLNRSWQGHSWMMTEEGKEDKWALVSSSSLVSKLFWEISSSSCLSCQCVSLFSCLTQTFRCPHCPHSFIFLGSQE
jgi:hypothetical protein